MHGGMQLVASSEIIVKPPPPSAIKYSKIFLADYALQSSLLQEMIKSFMSVAYSFRGTVSVNRLCN